MTLDTLIKAVHKKLNDNEEFKNMRPAVADILPNRKYKDARISKEQAAALVSAVISGMANGIVTNKELIIRNFGTFTVVRRKNHQGWRNPRTGEKSNVKSITNVKWKRSHKLDQVVN